MKKTFKKVCACLLGISVGIIGAQFVLADTLQSPGDPTIYPGQTGSRFSGRTGSFGSSGRFNSIQQVGMEIIRFIEVILVPLIISFAMLAFLWGVLQYIRKGGDPKEREQGRQFMLWGIIGLAVMVSVWGLVRILTNTLGAPLGIPSVNQIR